MFCLERTSTNQKKLCVVWFWNHSTVPLALLDFPSTQFQAMDTETSFPPGMLFDGVRWLMLLVLKLYPEYKPNLSFQSLGFFYILVI